MKNLYKITLITILALFAFSCEDNEEIEFTANGVESPTIVTPNSSIALSPETLENIATTIVWNDADYNIQTPVTYNVELAASGTNFENPVAAGTTAERFYSWTVKELNDAAIVAGLVPNEESALDVRVNATIGNEQEKIASNVAILTVTPFPNEDPKLFIVGGTQAYYENEAGNGNRNAWTPQEALPMNYIGDGTTKVFEAFMKLGDDDGFKFIPEAADWSVLSANYGSNGGVLDGTIVDDGGSSDIKPGVAGLYYVKVDLDTLTYQLVKMEWGIIGAATAGGWDNETLMTYDFDSNKFTINADVTTEQLKFRSKNTGNSIFGDGEDWKFNVGSGAGPVAADQGDGNFEVTAGNLDMELSFDFVGNATIGGL